MTITLDGTSGITTPTYGGNVTGEYTVPVTGFKNRIINGAMMIDQRNAGASVSTTAGAYNYTVDRWGYYASQASKFTIQQNAGSVTPPAGFSNYLGVTSSSAYSVLSSDIFILNQWVEGFNFADLAWGTANAKTVTLSFQVYSSLTGTFGGCIRNAAQNRSYTFSYTVSSANTWTPISITIPGDTTGTWVGATNGAGVGLAFSIGTGTAVSGAAGSWGSTTYYGVTGGVSVVGTNGATFYITGVQLEKGSTATSFDYRPYGTELALCQRYYEKSYSQSVVPGTASSTEGSTRIYANGTTSSVGGVSAQFAVVKRGVPTITFYSPVNGAAGYGYSYSTASNRLANSVAGTSSVFVYDTDVAVATSLNELFQWTASAEL